VLVENGDYDSCDSAVPSVGGAREMLAIRSDEEGSDHLSKSMTVVLD
jgi:hypothetical protein